MDTNTEPTVSDSNKRRNRRHSVDFKRAVVEQSYQPGSSVARLARELGVNANQVFAWRKLYRDQNLAGAEAAESVFLPVNVSACVPAVTPPIAAAPVEQSSTPATGTMELAIGKARLTICGRPDADLLRMVLTHLMR